MANHWLSTEFSIWSNEFDYIIASNLTEAKTYAAELMFGRNNPLALEQYEQYEKDELDSADWYELDPDSEFSYGHDDGTVERKTVREFIQTYGPGYFACSEW